MESINFNFYFVYFQKISAKSDNKRKTSRCSFWWVFTTKLSKIYLTRMMNYFGNFFELVHSLEILKLIPILSQLIYWKSIDFPRANRNNFISFWNAIPIRIGLNRLFFGDYYYLKKFENDEVGKIHVPAKELNWGISKSKVWFPEDNEIYHFPILENKLYW